MNTRDQGGGLLDGAAFRRLRPMRRLSPEECDRMGYAAPLVLSRRQVRFLIGPWRGTKRYVIEQGRRGAVWEGTKKELEDLGVAVHDDP